MSEPDRGPVVLVANVDHDFGALVVRFLNDRGRTAILPGSAREALSRWEELQPAFLVTGFDDGDLDGFEFLQAVTARAAAAHLPRPVVLVCARQLALGQLGPEPRRQLGIDLVLTRPCRLEAVEEALANIPAREPSVASPGASDGSDRPDGQATAEERVVMAS